MTRRRKLLTVGAILGLGVALSWPFRKEGNDSNSAAPHTASPPAETLRASNGDPIAILQNVAPKAGLPIAPAQMASTNSTVKPSAPAGQLESFDIANHPVLVGTANLLPPSTNVPSQTAEPTYPTVSATPHISEEEWPAELLHVVANGDTLERLADRYLNDAGRALEIFDLNRDQLSNPHLLPIGVELRVPRSPDRIVD